MTSWIRQDTPGNLPGIFGYSMNVFSFAVTVLIAVVVTPFVNFYLYTNDFPSEDQRQQIYDNIESDAWGIVLSSVAGLFLAIVIMFAMRFGRYLALFITLLEQLTLATGFSLLSIWAMWRNNSVTNSTLLTMMPFMVTQLAAYCTIQLVVLFGQGGKVLYNFFSLGAILGAFVGVSRSIQQNYFYFGGPDNAFGSTTERGIAFGNSILDTVFFVGSCSLASACIARSKAGGTILWHLPAFILPIVFSSVFSLYIELADYVPVLSSATARYFVGSLVALVAILLAIGVFYPITKRTMNTNRSKDGLYSANTSVGGPLALNAIHVV